MSASRPASVVKVTGRPTIRLPFASVTSATICTVPPVDRTALGLALRTRLATAAPPICTASSSVVTASPETALIVATPDWLPARRRTSTVPFRVRASRGSSDPSDVVRMTSVPFWTAVPPCSITVA